MKKMKTILLIIGGVSLFVLACFAFIHRRVIKAWITGGEMPEVPEGHPECCPYTMIEEEPAEELAAEEVAEEVE